MPELPSPSVTSRKSWEWQCWKSAEKAMIWVGAWFIAFLRCKRQRVYIVFLEKLEFLETLLRTFKTTSLL